MDLNPVNADTLGNPLELPIPPMKINIILATAVLAMLSTLSPDVLAQASAPKAKQSRPVAAPSMRWQYATERDPMKDGSITVATLQSPTTIKLGFPYGGGVRARLWIKHVSGQADEFVFQVNSGQLLNSEGITFRFDDAPQFTMTTNGASDGSSQNLWLAFSQQGSSLASEHTVLHTDRAKFFDALAGADRLLVKVTFYSEGEKIFTFTPKGLKWPELLTP